MIAVEWIKYAWYWGFHAWTQPSRKYDWVFDLGRIRIARRAWPGEGSRRV